MNKYYIDPFINILPQLDLHGETRDTITFLIKDFLIANLKIGNHKVVIVHGRHGGVLKKKTHEVLKTLKIVDKFYICGSNDGITIVELTSLKKNI